MIVLKNTVNLYSKKVIADLASRVGPPTMDSFTCCNGLRLVVNNYWPGGLDSTDADIETLFSKQTDFNPDIIQPHLNEDDYDETVELEEYEVGEVYNPAVDKLPFKKYFRRLEDIAQPYLEKYVGNLVYSSVNHTSGGFKQYERTHKAQATLFNSNDDDDSITELADLQVFVNENEWPVEVKQVALDNLPYVIKRLHILSCYCKVHMLSYISAYLKAKDINDKKRVAGYTKTLKANAVIEEGAYLYTPDGFISKKVEIGNKNIHAQSMFDWITGANKNYEAYYKDFLDFVHYCEVLDIDILNDDMTKYDANFVNKLIVKTVTPNSQYDKQIYDALRSRLVIPIKNDADEVDPVLNTIDLFLDVIDYDSSIAEVLDSIDSDRCDKNLQNAKMLAYTDGLMFHNEFRDASNMYWQDGYLYYNNDLVIINTDLFSSVMFEDRRCIISESGYLLQLSKLNCLYLMHIDHAVLNFNARREKDINYTEAKWWRCSV